MKPSPLARIAAMARLAMRTCERRARRAMRRPTRRWKSVVTRPQRGDGQVVMSRDRRTAAGAELREERRTPAATRTLSQKSPAIRDSINLGRDASSKASAASSIHTCRDDEPPLRRRGAANGHFMLPVRTIVRAGVAIVHPASKMCWQRPLLACPAAKFSQSLNFIVVRRTPPHARLPIVQLRRC